ncbi:biotin--[acetyl-CoA-carboxylase] ligase [Neolewinella antarctica]|uniref:BirA family biotin operon repressor/biotin-[acetyl-CoA-carboxylase] ligase n=1 Tax=Neolewinella antarctica TaxID=442734 RepID=A0ABX0X9V8_9BACT|nr:biotin--[acetyl-CoA-carboxylase] ligase [Neolewinella antarctica]NJC26022.1 BirA family biotin operon repressor/biotin-[acetyl-CoA-carboxylase] ligase [Neolewinella antarctica]
MPEINKPLVAKVARTFARAASTNALAVAAITSATPPGNGDVFLAHEQTAGRGQGSNSWHATPYANLSFSIVCYPTHLTVARLFVLSQVTALAVAATVRSLLPRKLGTRVRVKWPNDVYVGDQKIAGILIQNGLRGSNLAWSVIGVGLNVNEWRFPPQLSASATSLFKLTNQEHDLDAVLETLLANFAEYYALTLDPAGITELDRLYGAQLYRQDAPSRFLHVATNREFSGIIDGVNDAGQLTVIQVGGRTSAFDLREIKLL